MATTTPKAAAVGRPGGGDRGGPNLFSRVTVDRVSQVIVDQIKLLIRDGS